MIINLGDTIRDERGREGVVTNIGIATEPTDIAAESENSLSAKTYDTDLNYTGAVTFGDNWCYFMQIQEVIKKNGFSVPIGRYGTSEEVAALVVFLCSNAASYINGSAIEVDGGQAGHI